MADFKENHTILWFYKSLQIRETRKLKSIHELHFVELKNEGKKPDKISSLRRLKFMPRNLDKNAIQEFHLRCAKLYSFAAAAVLL
jgi:hypothetical protein